jgi:hypothetical protein
VAHRYRRSPPGRGGGADGAATAATDADADADADASAFLYPGLDDWGYGKSIEWRFTRGSLDSLGPADVWARVRLPLVHGLALTGQDRALITADSANGLSLSLPLNQWLSIPPTMTATLLRPPVGEWVHLACRTYLTDDGVGFAHADLFDGDGLIGEVAQPLLLQRRAADSRAS